MKKLRSISSGVHKFIVYFPFAFKVLIKTYVITMKYEAKKAISIQYLIKPNICDLKNSCLPSL